jgi:glycosyltransferase involved in cell wall biosynthesis
MLTHSYYEEDPRVRREAEALVAAGHPVDVYALRRPGEAPEAEVAGVRVHHLDVQRHQGARLAVYLREYLDFFVRAALALVRAQPRRHYALVQVHTLPDFLSLAALPLRMVGVPVLIDLHEAMPEFFRSRFPRASNPLVYRALLLQERLAIAAANHAQTVNDALADRLVERGVARSRVSVVRNSPSLARFDATRYPARTFAQDGVVRLVYTGAVTPTYELDVAIAAIARLRELRPALAVTLDVFGRGDSEEALQVAVNEAGLAAAVSFHGRIPLEDVPAAIVARDIGLAPTRRDPFTDISLSTKIFEYGAMGKPAICSRLPMVERTFGPGTVWTYAPGDADDLAAAILAVVEDAPAREAAVALTRETVTDHAWEREAVTYVAIVDRLIGGARS